MDFKTEEMDIYIIFSTHKYIRLMGRGVESI